MYYIMTHFHFPILFLSTAQSKVKTDQGCQTNASLTGDLNDIHDDLVINWADAGRRWSDSVYGKDNS